MLGAAEALVHTVECFNIRYIGAGSCMYRKMRHALLQCCWCDLVVDMDKKKRPLELIWASCLSLPELPKKSIACKHVKQFSWFLKQAVYRKIAQAIEIEHHYNTAKKLID